MSINYSHLFLVLIFLIITPTNSEKEIKKITGNELDTQIKLASKSNTKLFLVFYVNNCFYCSHALKILTEKVIKNFKEKDKVNFCIIDLDDQKNIWTGLRFNISKIPYVVLIYKNKMYHYQREFEENSVINFIKEEKNIEDALTIPPPSTFLDKLYVVNKQINENISLFFEKYGIRKEISNKISYLIIISCFFLFAYIEIKIISLCGNIFQKKKTNVKKEEKDNNKNNTNNDNNTTKKTDKIKKE